MDYTSWVNLVHSLGGVATVWPFAPDVYVGNVQGQPAARFDNATYAAEFNAGALPAGVGTQAAPNGQYVYVLGSTMGGATVPAGAPPNSLTLAQQIENEAFVAGDEAASAAGLPSLAAIEAAAKKYALLAGVGVLVLLVADHYAHGGR